MPIETCKERRKSQDLALAHHKIKTTQVYLGKVSDSEAIRWMDILHDKWFNRKSAIFPLVPRRDCI